MAETQEERQPQIINLVYGTPVWIQIPAEDVARAKNFYEKVFHWEFIKPGANGPPPEFLAEFRVPDSRLRQPGVSSGGIVRIDPEHHIKVSADVAPEGTRGAPHMYLFVKSIDASLKQIENAGGKAIGGKKTEDPSSFIAHFLDTEGNVQGLYESILGGGST
ncbi:MAG: hypothetical protein M1816_000021 [Peltula sp. TS41687]|nr:MAG: hypothetical protein M1816_000021 [Peltula sp. TS41687]